MVRNEWPLLIENDSGSQPARIWGPQFCSSRELNSVIGTLAWERSRG